MRLLLHMPAPRPAKRGTPLIWPASIASLANQIPGSEAADPEAEPAGMKLVHRVAGVLVAPALATYESVDTTASSTVEAVLLLGRQIWSDAASASAVWPDSAAGFPLHLEVAPHALIPLARQACGRRFPIPGGPLPPGC